ncbi:MAG: efflux RND transporter periplasmic adaptor subunit [Burkholderiaceae bacterium]
MAASGNGTLAAVLVERGDSVRKGQLLASLTDEVERAAVHASQQRAASGEEIAAAEVGVEVARTRLSRVRQLVKLGYGSMQELDQADGEARIAEHRLGQARDNREQATRQARVAERQLQSRQIRSPFDGVVADRLLQPGERVDGRPVFRILALDRLKVEVIAPSSVFGLIPEGAQLDVMPEIPKASAHPARVVQADRYIDPASGTFRMRLSLPNGDRSVPAGVRCKVLLDDVAGLTVGAAGAAGAAGGPVAHR